jgi:hypothetical protein
MKAADFMSATLADAAFVSTNSICQGIQVSSLWPVIFARGVSISFAYQSFKWANLASYNAGVTVSIVGLTKHNGATRKLFSIEGDGTTTIRETDNINAYLVAGGNVFVSPRNKVPDDRTAMQFGNHPYYANDLMLRPDEARQLVLTEPQAAQFIRPLYGSKELISGSPRACLWITRETLADASAIPAIEQRIEGVRAARLEKSSDAQAHKLVDMPYRFRDQYEAVSDLLVVSIVSSENRPYLPRLTSSSRRPWCITRLSPSMTRRFGTWRLLPRGCIWSGLPQFVCGCALTIHIPTRLAGTRFQCRP